jgi:S1-C subfamily serine protease
LLKYGEVQRGLLGVQIQDVTSELADKEGLKEVKGVFIAKVNEKSAADDAGIKDKDVIVSVDGESVNSSNELQEKVGKRSPGEKVKVGILRNNKNLEFEVTLKNKDGKIGIVKSEKIERDSLYKELDNYFKEHNIVNKYI